MKSTAPLLSPGYTWLYVFLPSFVYFIITRISFGRDVGVSIAVSSQVECQESPVLSCATSQWFRVAPHWGVALSDSLWIHDDELGRGYLIASDLQGAGRIWRWEVGGGPIAIGSTLHMEQAGCRSKDVCLDATTTANNYGVTALAMEPSAGETSLLVVAEQGEQRIVRVEATTGARTPLLLLEDDASIISSMAYTATGDLLYILSSVETEQQEQLMRLPQAVHTQALPSLAKSRVAHGWTTLPPGHSVSLPHTIHSSSTPSLSWMGSLVANATMLFYAGVLEESGEAVLMRVQLEQDDLDDDDDTEFELRPIIHARFPTVGASKPGPIALSNEGTIFAAIGDTLWILPNGKLSKDSTGRFPLPTATITSLTVGGDGYLYATSATDLYRIRTTSSCSPVHLPANKIPKRKKPAAPE